MTVFLIQHVDETPKAGEHCEASNLLFNQEEEQRYSLLPSRGFGILPHVVFTQRLLSGVSATQ